MIKKITAVILSLCIICLAACKQGDNADNALSELTENARDESIKSEDFKVFPDGVDLTDSTYTEILTPDLENDTTDDDSIIDYNDIAGGFGFTLPDGVEKAYKFSFKEEKDNKKVNPCAECSVYVLSPFFPQTKEYVRVSAETLLTGNSLDYEGFRDHIGSFVNKKLSARTAYEDYLAFAKADIEANKLLFEHYETVDIYNFRDVKASSSDYCFNPTLNNINTNTGELGIVYVSYYNSIYAVKAPDSSISGIESEMFELDNGNFGLKTSYTLTRYGITVNREAYWLFEPDTDHLIRVEFNYEPDKKRIIDAKKFLENTYINVYTPDNSDKT